jgi:site-specific recombinase XerC
MDKTYKQSDSTAAQFMKAALATKGAATLTKTRMQTTFQALQVFGRKQRWGESGPASLTPKQLKGFVAFRIEEGISARSIQNEMSHVRRALQGVGRIEPTVKAAGRALQAQGPFSNKELGVPSGTRIGSGKVVDPEVLKRALEHAPADTKALIELSRSLGLREREAIQSGPSLREWDQALSQGQPIIVRDGTKGGRARSVVVAPEGLGRALGAVKAAEAVLELQKQLVVSKSLKAAIEQHSDRLAKLGLKGENSCHSLRRAFAMDQYKHYLVVGCTQKVALSRTSNDLGHGDGRGRWVFNNYIRSSLEGC